MQIFVLGMHRSGTSMVTRLVNMMGVNIGKEKKLIKPQIDNPKGFWERQDINNLNNELLRSNGLEWFKLSNFDERFLTLQSKDKFEIGIQKIISELNESIPWVLKDPRFCITFPLIKKFLDKPLIIVVYRHPLEVAISLQERNGFDIQFCIFLWEYYYASLFKGIEGIPRITINFENVINHPHITCDKILTFLQSFSNSKLKIPDKKNIDNYISTDLYRSNKEEFYNSRIIESFLSETQSKLYKKLSTSENIEIRENEIEVLKTKLHAFEPGAIVSYFKKYNSNMDEKLHRIRSIIESSQKLNSTIFKGYENLFNEFKSLNQLNEQRNINSIKNYKSQLEQCQSKILLLENDLRIKNLNYESITQDLEKYWNEYLKYLDQNENKFHSIQQHLELTKSSLRWRIGNFIISKVKKVLFKRNYDLSLSIVEREISALLSSNAQLKNKVIQLKNNLPEILNQPTNYNQVERNYYKLHRKEKIVVYTAIIGNYDSLFEPTHVPLNVNFICFSDTLTDNNDSIWQIRPVSYYNSDPTRIARYIKTHPHALLSEYGISIWIDANLQINGSIEKFLVNYTENNIFSCPNHPFRTNIFEEGSKCIEFNKDEEKTITNQLEQYKKKYNIPQVLFETSILVRTHNTLLCQKINQEWWSHLQNYSKRDQISLPIVLQNLGVKTSAFGNNKFNMRNDPSVIYHHHLKKTAEDSKITINYTEPFEVSEIIKYISYDTKQIKFTFGICVYNALEDVKACLNSIISCSESHDEIIIIDDNSNAETAEWLQDFAKKNHILLYRNTDNKGYTFSANRILELSTGDYVALINSDAVVSSKFREKILFWGEVFPESGIISPLSNAAGWQSIPELLDNDQRFKVNALPLDLGIKDMDNLCATISNYEKVSVPDLNGFCFVIKRKVIATIGIFDYANFPKGYGEENDYCIRCTDAGFDCIIATNCFVWHSKSKSFGNDIRVQLSEQGTNALRKKYSENRLNNIISTMKTHPYLDKFRQEIKIKLDELYIQNPKISNVIRFAVIVPGRKDAGYYGSTHIRLLSHLENSEFKNFYKVFNFNEFIEIKEYNPSMILIQRISEETERASILSLAAINKIPVYFDLDDNLFHSDSFLNHNKVISSIMSYCFCSEKVSTSTTMLKKALERFNKNTYVIENCILSDYWGDISNKVKNKTSLPNILYFGTHTHENDLMVCHDALIKIKEKYPDIKIWLIGISKNINTSLHFENVSVPQSHVQYPDFVQWLKSFASQCHIGIAPLVDNDFNRCKSDIKFLEYTACNLITVASDVGPYKFLSKKKLGVTCKNTNMDWFEKLEKVILNYNSHETIKKNAMNYVSKMRNSSQPLERFESLFYI